MSSESTRRNVLRIIAGTTVAGTLFGTASATSTTGGNELWRYESQYLLRHGPTVVDGTAYVIENGSLYGFDSDTGDQELMFRGWGGGNIPDDLGQDPHVVDGMVYCGGSKSRFGAIDVTDGGRIGESEWLFEPEDVRSFSETSPTVANGTLYTVGGYHGGTIFFALDADSGEEKWRMEADSRPFSPVVVEDTVYFAEPSNLYALDADSGEEIWSTELGAGINTVPTVVDGTVYVGYSSSTGGNYAAVDADTGAEQWAFKTESSFTVREPTVADGTLYCRDEETLVAASADSGEEQWRYEAGDYKDSTAPTVADGVVYFGDKHGQIHAVSATNGDGLWQVEIGDEPVSSQPIVVDGVLYAVVDMSLEGQHQGDLVAIEAEGDGSSIDSRVVQGVLNHNDGWTGDGAAVISPGVSSEGSDDDGSSGNGTDGEEGNGDDDDGSPGFGIVSGIAAVGGGAYAASRRLRRDEESAD